MTRKEAAAMRAFQFKERTPENERQFKSFVQGYEQAEQDTIHLIESRISEIIGDAQPKPALRAELQELITRIKEK